MNIDVIKSLAIANSKLPEIAFFAYRGVEIIEFGTHADDDIELVNGSRIYIKAIEFSDLTLKFDTC